MVNCGDIGGEQCIVVQFASVQSVHCSVFTSAQRRDDIDGEQQSIVVHSTVERRDDIGELMCFSSQCSLFTVHSRVHR